MRPGGTGILTAILASLCGAALLSHVVQLSSQANLVIIALGLPPSLAIAVACNVVLCELGARIGLPGVDGSAVQRFFQTAHRSLLMLYNLLVAGAVSRAAILALGTIPYLEAQVYVWLGRAASPAIGAPYS